MRGNRKAAVLALSLACLFVAGLHLAVSQQAPPANRDDLVKTYKAGNYKDAYDGLRKLALDPKDDPLKVGDDLNLALDALRSLGRSEEIDDFREAVIAAHKDNWRLLHTAAQSFNRTEKYGYIVAGKFYRGHKRGGKGRYVSTFQRDRVRALQLMDQALARTTKESDKAALAQFHLDFATMLVNGTGWHEAWRLQYLTNLGELPDYEDAYRYYGNRGGLAPVDDKGNPVLHVVPKEYKIALTDGERWRWMLSQAAEFAPDRLSEIDMLFASFLQQQFGVQTMAYYGSPRRSEEDKEKDKSGPYALHTLKDSETIARLASGIKRFSLPDEFNYLKVWQKVANRGKTGQGESARDLLAGEFENRRQYVTAEKAWSKAIDEYGAGHVEYRRKRLNQIIGNWGRFEPAQAQTAGNKGTVEFRFRNGNKVSLEAHAIKVETLLNDVKAFLKANPANRQDLWEKVQLSNIGYRLVEKNEKQYLGDKVASWDIDLKPEADHVDSRITVKAPMTRPGAYLVTATMANGNTSRVIIWLNDTVIARKQLEGKVMYFVADANTGTPVDKANLEFFGYKTTPINPQQNQWKIDTTSFAEFSDNDGLSILDGKTLPSEYTWLVIARKAKAGEGGADRFAHLGFSGVWYGSTYDPEYSATKTFVMTDRPVYRPSQKVQFKAWVRHAKYDQNDNSPFAGESFLVRINNPKGEKVYEKTLKADDHAGLSDELELAKDATLGTYGIQIERPVHHGVGNSSFRVEEYKKPEFEVKIEAPKEPVQLGETIDATIEAKYYFGAPVVNAKVKVKVLRTSYSSDWYPRGRWDWFYGPGYWWFAADYDWYPGFREWGCKRPWPMWMHRNWEQPEVVSEVEVPIGADGIVKLPIDTMPAKALHPDQDHKYAITAEVTDESRRTIVGTGNVLVARKPFKVFTWVDRGHYRVGDTIKADFSAHTLDSKPVQGKGELKLYSLSYDKDAHPWEKEVGGWSVDTDVEGKARQQMKASKAGQYRLSYKVTDSKKHTIEGGYVFVVRGEGEKGDYRFNDVELVTEKREYSPGEKVKLLVNTNQKNGTVLLFARPAGVYQAPKVLRLQGKSIEDELTVVQRDMPNFFVEALTVHGGGVFTEVREVVVPPEKRILNVAVMPNKSEYKPGERAAVKVKLTDADGKPFVGTTAMSIYDRSVEYISGGSNVPEIKEFYWKWRRHHQPQTETSVAQWFGNLLRHTETPMGNIGVFGEMLFERDLNRGRGENEKKSEKGAPMAPGGGFGGGGGPGGPPAQDGAPADKKPGAAAPGEQAQQGGQQAPPGVEPTVRKNFADTAYWNGTLTTNQEGIAEVSLAMPENLTGWKVRVWAMGHGTRVGESTVEVTTKKDLLVRLQAPRFFVQKDEVVLSANVHNYLKSDKDVTVSLELEGKTLEVQGSATQKVKIKAKGEKRVDWTVSVKSEGNAIVRMKAITDEESDAMQMTFPCYVHGMLKTDSYSGVVRPDKESSKVSMTVPKERRINESLLEVRYSPTLAGALVDALPYMVDYPYGCTEQTLNRFLPTVITQRILLEMKLDLKDIQKKRTNLNAQEIGDPMKRAEGWKRLPRNPVFDEAEVRNMSKAGVQRLQDMQCSDGGWGWFSGWGERSYPHTTAVVVHGLQLAQLNGVAIVPGVIERGVEWLQNYQTEQVRMLNNAPSKTKPYKEFADNLDALVHMVLVDAGVVGADMRDYLYRDRTHLAVYAKAMFGLALTKEQKQEDKLKMILKNIEQFVVQDEENQTSYLKLPEGNAWWYWYGSDIEANAYYLKLLTRTSPKEQTASRLVKYLLNNRKNATYWNSTRDTAICIEAMAEYLRASGEDKPDMTIEVWLDGKKRKEVKVNSENLFSFDGTFALTGDAVEDGKHELEIRKKGTGPVYFNAYLTNFTLEDFITKAGLEVKVNRKYYKLERVDKTIKVPGSRGQAADQKVEKYKRIPLDNQAILKSGELVEVELEIDSKNDYEYVLFEDMKAAGFEAVETKSGYNGNDMGAYMELRDDRVSFFARTLARGKHSVSYRLRAEIPGKFSALPARANAMYAPELRGNSDEIKLKITD